VQEFVVPTKHLNDDVAQNWLLQDLITSKANKDKNAIAILVRSSSEVAV
jgi:hypothetical protein